jgi:alpha-glucosidase (family GH31 glycosyl hydrolase)
LSEPPNSYLGSGPFAQDPNLFSLEILESFDYWMGTGRLLVAGAFQEGIQRKRVYFPQAYPGDTTPYIRVSDEINESYPAGTWAEIDLPLTEFAIFARAGAVIPVGKDHVTVTNSEGIAKTCVGGTEIQVDNDNDSGVSLDDYRGIEIFPPTDASANFRGEGTWIEDDGVSRKPTTTVVKVEYRVIGEEIQVEAKFIKREFGVAWGKELWVFLPKGDTRAVQGGQTGTRKGRQGYKIIVR